MILLWGYHFSIVHLIVLFGGYMLSAQQVDGSTALVLQMCGADDATASGPVDPATSEAGATRGGTDHDGKQNSSPCTFASPAQLEAPLPADIRRALEVLRTHRPLR